VNPLLLFLWVISFSLNLSAPTHLHWTETLSTILSSSFPLKPLTLSTILILLLLQIQFLEEKPLQSSQLTLLPTPSLIVSQFFQVWSCFTLNSKFCLYSGINQASSSSCVVMTKFSRLNWNPEPSLLRRYLIKLKYHKKVREANHYLIIRREICSNDFRLHAQVMNWCLNRIIECVLDSVENLGFCM